MLRFSHLFRRFFATPGYKSAIAAAALLLAFGLIARAQQAAPAGSRYDITNYRIEVQLQPDDHTLRAGADVTFTPAEPTRSVVFELNGSLKVNTVEKDGKVLTGVVQDPLALERWDQMCALTWDRSFRREPPRRFVFAGAAL
jgi:hypothetical protein